MDTKCGPVTMYERREAWREYRRQVAHCYSDATTPGFFKIPEAPDFSEPTALDVEREADALAECASRTPEPN